jgi:EthD domain
MNKLMYAVWREPGVDPDQLAVALLTDVGRRLVDLAAGVQVNVSDGAVGGAVLRLTAFEQPVDAVVSVWLSGNEAEAVSAAISALELVHGTAGWWVDEAVATPPPIVPLGVRHPGLANMAFLRRPAPMKHEHWRDRWKNHHTQVAIETQATFGYVQNEVLHRATEDAPTVAAIVEELFPIEALSSFHAFYGSDGDDVELGRRMTAMLKSVTTFGADTNVDVIPTSRYLLSGPPV